MPTRFQAAFQYATRGQQVPTLLQGNPLFVSINVISHTRQPESAWATNAHPIPQIPSHPRRVGTRCPRVMNPKGSLNPSKGKPRL